ncbi:MAG: S-methyl thiohydantoin desulfurase domain-containing protein, partial [Candidatus Heimdallarchaeota archaeon]
AIAREMAVLSGGTVGVARCPAYWSAYQKAVIPGTMSWAKKLGTIIRLAREKEQPPLEPLLNLLKSQYQPSQLGHFHARVKGFEVADRGGFVVGEIYLEDEHDHSYKVWFKNEFLIVWRDGVPFAFAPDLICIVDATTCEGLTPWENDFSSGREVVVIMTKNHPIWYCSRGLELFGPKHFGFNFDYQPRKI